VPSLLVGNPKVPAKDLKELIALARQKPGKLTIGIGGIGSSLHLAGDRFKMMAGVDLLNVPYKGTAPALTDVMGGQVDLMFISLVTGTAQVQAGNLRAYGVTSARRQPAFPDLLGSLADPRMREQLVREGANPAALTPAEFAAFVRADIERWAPVVRSSGAKPN
jgi:tripartite-type tricarboxylate transporter receptor subunit TctC